MSPNEPMPLRNDRGVEAKAAAGAAAEHAAGVVLLALVGVGQHRVGLLDLLEALLGLRVARVRVRVPLARKAPVGLLDLLLGGPLLHAQRVVEVSHRLLLGGTHDDACRPQDLAVQPIALLQHLEHQARLTRPGQHRLVPVGVERLALRRVALDARAASTPTSSSYTSRTPSREVILLVGSAAASARSRLSSTGSSDRGKLPPPPSLGLGSLASNALPKVLEIRLGALRKSEILIPLLSAPRTPHSSSCWGAGPLRPRRAERRGSPEASGFRHRRPPPRSPYERGRHQRITSAPHPRPRRQRLPLGHPHHWSRAISPRRLRRLLVHLPRTPCGTPAAAPRSWT